MVKKMELEIEELDDPILKCIYFKKLRKIHTKSELDQLQREVRILKETTFVLGEDLREKEMKSMETDQKIKDYQNNLEDLSILKDQFLKKIEEAIKNNEKIKKNVEKEIEVNKTVEVVKKRRSVLLDSLLLIYLMRSNMDKFLKIPLSIAIVNGIYNKFQEKDEIIIHYEYKYEDIKPTIEKAMNSIDDLETEMENSLTAVQDTISDFEKDFEEYCHLKEFQEILDMLQTVEKSIQKEFGTIQEMQDDLKESFDINKEKVLKIESN